MAVIIFSKFCKFPNITLKKTIYDTSTPSPSNFGVSPQISKIFATFIIRIRTKYSLSCSTSL